MPRMSRAELAGIVTKGVAAARMTIGKAAADRIATLSQGLPHYTHLLSQLAAQSALDAHRTDVTVGDVEFAIQRAIEKAQHSIMDANGRAIASTRRSLYREVLAACALASCDEFGFFVPSDVRGPLSKIVGKPCDTQAFGQHLDELSGPARGPMRQKRGEPRRFRYRFVNPLLQPYVVMRALSDRLVRQRDLR